MIVLFPFIGLWFWVYVVISLGFLSSWVYRDKYGWATFDVVVFLALLSVTGHIPIVDLWHHIQTNPVEPALWVSGFLITGVAWATFKWKRLLLKVRGLLRKWQSYYKMPTKAELEKDSGYDLTEVEHLNKHLDRHMREHMPSDLLYRYHVKIVDGKPKIEVSEYKSRIIGWMAYWWVSAPLWLIGDFLADVFDALYRMVKGFYQKMADNTLSD